MTSLSLEKAEKRLEQYLIAEEKVLLAQEYRLDGRIVTRANLKEIRDGINYWERKCNEIKSQLNKRKIRSYRVLIKND